MSLESNRQIVLGHRGSFWPQTSSRARQLSIRRRPTIGLHGRRARMAKHVGLCKRAGLSVWLWLEQPASWRQRPSTTRIDHVPVASTPAQRTEAAMLPTASFVSYLGGKLAVARLLRWSAAGPASGPEQATECVGRPNRWRVGLPARAGHSSRCLPSWIPFEPGASRSRNLGGLVHRGRFQAF
jgi:hypothetical protein